jgi:hypothetical protein
MRREDAEREAAIHNAAAEADTRWLVRERADDDWEPVRLTAPGLGAVRPTGTRTDAQPRDDQPSDPRPAFIRNVPPYGGGF